MRKLKALLQKYESRYLALDMEIEFLKKHSYQLEVMWKESEREIVLDMVKDLRECLNGVEKKLKNKFGYSNNMV
jgi:hypothetical protein